MDPWAKSFEYTEAGALFNVDDVIVSAQTRYNREKSFPHKNHYFFSYRLHIQNQTIHPLQVISRQWIILNGKKTKRFIHAEKLMGHCPWIEPGESFTYCSFCPLDTPTGNMRGKIMVRDLDKETYSLKVPLMFFRRDLH